MNTEFRPVIIAGGSGTRFWPRSRKARAKQVLALDGERTMIQRTLDRLMPLARPQDVWVITNDLLSAAICGQLQAVPQNQVIREPAARNTAPAVGLAAFLTERSAPDAVLGIFPADHTISNESRFLDLVRQAIEIAAAGDNMVVMGITPTRPETGYGYIETGEAAPNGAVRVRRFTEKPDRERAEQFVSAGNYYWNSGMFFWSARTLVKAVREHMPNAAPHLDAIAAAFGTPDFQRVFAERYPKCDSISVDYAILEPRSARGESNSRLYCLPADFGWNDLGSWSALYEHQLASNSGKDVHDNVCETAGSFALGAHRNYVYSPHKFVSLIGVEDLVIVETDDALLITARDRSQDVGKIVKLLDDTGRKDLV